MYFTEIRKTRHYKEEHEDDVPWHVVVEVILRTKDPRKTGDTYTITTDAYYVTFTIDNGTLWVINAKRND